MQSLFKLSRQSALQAHVAQQAENKDRLGREIKTETTLHFCLHFPAQSWQEVVCVSVSSLLPTARASGAPVPSPGLSHSLVPECSLASDSEVGTPSVFPLSSALGLLGKLG